VLASQVGEGLDRPGHDVANRIAGVLRTPTAELALKCLARRHQLLAAELATLERRQRFRFKALMVEVRLAIHNTTNRPKRFAGIPTDGILGVSPQPSMILR
jgi:hypothetical protein